MVVTSAARCKMLQVSCAFQACKFAAEGLSSLLSFFEPSLSWPVPP